MVAFFHWNVVDGSMGETVPMNWALPAVPPFSELERIGVRRVSTGSLLARAAYGTLLAGAEELAGHGTSHYAEQGGAPVTALRRAFG